MMETLVVRLFFAGNFILFLGTIMLIWRLVKDRKALHGYSFLGSVLTLMAVAVFTIAFWLSGQWLSVAFAIPTVAYWGFVVFSLVFYG